MNPLYRLLGARQAGNAEAAHDAGFVKPEADDVLHRFNNALRCATSSNVRPAAHATAADTVAQQVEHALKQLHQDPQAALSRNQRLGLESVVRADGTRPSLVVTGGGVDLTHPMAATWRDRLVGARDAIELLAPATARVQPRAGSYSRFFGTAFLVGMYPARMVTNRHVAMQALRRSVATREAAPHPMLTSYQVHAGTIEVEFEGLQDSVASKLAAVQRVILPPWPNSAKQPSMDIAILELGPELPDNMPDPIVLQADAHFEIEGTLNSFCTIGFPAPPTWRTGIVDGIDWAYVDRAIFNERYGVKRLAPGIVTKSFEEIDRHGAGYTFGHDATTLGGSSGSAICAWKDKKKVFGLHFSGGGAESNRAHGFSSPYTEELLRAFGLMRATLT